MTYYDAMRKTVVEEKSAADGMVWYGMVSS